jgi:hypothetical protein
LGSITVRASQAGNDYFNAASPVEQTFLVIKRDQTITFEPISDKILTENSFDLQASASSNLPIQFELVEGDATLNNKTLTFNKIGFITVRATQPGNNVYNAAEPVERTFYVAPEGLQLQVSPNPFRDRIKMTLQGKYTGNVEIWVYDALGRTVLKGNFEKTTLRYDGVYILDAQPKEIYFLRVTTKEKEFIQKIVKQ